jgi:ribonuclease HI
LSQAGKEVLLKAVIQAIPTYTMSIFLLPKSLCHRINSMMRKFWWDHKDNLSRVAWMGWDKMSQSKDVGGLGCRDLEIFNQALLAKQGWRILQKPGSLVGKIFREKYFRGSSFFTATVGRNPSYAWRSMLKARGILDEGLVWRIGDGSSIRIWEDKWVQPTLGYNLKRPIVGVNHEDRVSILIDQESRWWNVPKLQEMFSEVEVQTICKIPICPGGQSDQLVWGGTKNGMYTVRSGYHMKKEEMEKEMGSCSDSGSHKGLRRRIWKVRGSQALQMFLWRACQNALPTKANLKWRHIVSDSLCPLCGLYEETVGHLLWYCQSARDVWIEGPKALHKCTSDDTSFKEIFLLLMEKLDEATFQLFIIVARLLWFRRNQVVHGGEMQSPISVMKQAKEQIDTFERATASRVHNSTSAVPINKEKKWEKPPMNFVKVNWDAAISKEHNITGVGVILRDHRGDVIASFCTHKPTAMEPASAEAMAAWYATEICKQMDARYIILEGDAKEITQALQCGSLWRGSYCMLIDEARRNLQQLCEWHVRHVFREANEVAHNLAKVAISRREETMWNGNYPDCIHVYVLADQQGSS